MDGATSAWYEPAAASTEPTSMLWDQPPGGSLTANAISSYWPATEIGAWGADDSENTEPWWITRIVVQGEYEGNVHDAGMLYWCIYPDAPFRTGMPGPGAKYPAGDTGACQSYAPSDLEVSIDESHAPLIEISLNVNPRMGIFSGKLLPGRWWLIFYADIPNDDAGFLWRSADTARLNDAGLLVPPAGITVGQPGRAGPP